MMDFVIHVSNMNVELIKKMLADVSEEQICQQPSKSSQSSALADWSPGLCSCLCVKVGPKPFVFPEA